MKTLLIDTLLVDYVTATFYDLADGTYMQLLRTQRELGGRVRHDVRRLQYAGALVTDQGGTCYLGVGEQRGKPHCIFQVSGAWANDLWHSCVKGLAVAGLVKLTRIDIQVTKTKPANIHLVELYNRAASATNTVSHIESCVAGEKLATLYFGSRSSERFWRIYEKPGPLSKLLRAELELKGDVANQLPHHLKLGLAQIYNHYLSKLPWTEIVTLFTLPGTPPGMFVPARANTDTEAWLLGTVVPALNKFLATEPDPSQVVAAFEEVIERYYKYRHS